MFNNNNNNNKMFITDRPGRFYALCILSPFLIFSGIKIKNNNKLLKSMEYYYMSRFLIFNGGLLFLYELYWLSFKNNETILK